MQHKNEKQRFSANYNFRMIFQTNMLVLCISEGLWAVAVLKIKDIKIPPYSELVSYGGN